MNWIGSSIAERTLEHLARYRYLTIPQLVLLGAGGETGVRTRLLDLKTAKLISRKTWHLGPSTGRLPNVHWLTEKGARLMTERCGFEIKSPSRAKDMQASHFPHRRLTIDTIIAADLWAMKTGQTVPNLATYLQWEGQKFAPTTITVSGKVATADVIFRTKDTSGKRRFYVLEVYCSRYKGGLSGFAIDQLEPYVLAGENDKFDDDLGILPTDPAARILVVCDTLELKERLMRLLPARKGMPPITSPTWRRFLFKTADELAEFGVGWLTFSGASVDLPQ